jgi:hypothetical protein
MEPMKKIATLALLLCGFAFGEEQTVSLERIQVTSSNIGDVLVLRAPGLVGSANCHQNPWYTIWYLPITDGKATYIQSAALTAFTTKKTVKVYYDIAAANANTSPYGLTGCRITGIELSNP